MRRTRSEVLGHAVRTAIRNPGRTTLTMLGLAIGVGAFLAMLSFGTSPGHLASHSSRVSKLFSFPPQPPHVNSSQRPVSMRMRWRT